MLFRFFFFKYVTNIKFKTKLMQLVKLLKNINILWLSKKNFTIIIYKLILIFLQCLLQDSQSFQYQFFEITTKGKYTVYFIL